MTAMYALNVERQFDTTAAAVFDGFMSMYDEPRPDWIISSDCDLRVGGQWDVVFRPPGIEAFSEHRMLTVVDRPRRLDYTVTVHGNRPAFDTVVSIVIEPDDEPGTRLSLSQYGFPDASTRDDFAAAWPDVMALLAEELNAS